MATTLKKKYGGSPNAIEHHYDVGTDFYSAWLDARLVYSCAMWDGLDREATLEQAQYRKLEYHANNCSVKAGSSILDVGCGWGSMLRYLAVERGVRHAEGLTLSPEQHAYIGSLNCANIKTRLESWTDYEPTETFDGIISIGAFEHFADATQTRETRRDLYRLFFTKCTDWLAKDGSLSLQTIAYGNMTPKEANSFIANDIFPNSELPFLSDIAVASEGVLEIVEVRNDAIDYARTCEEWERRLRLAKRANPAFCSDETFNRYKLYLRLSAYGFRMGRLQLLRLKLSKPGWRNAS